VPRCDDFSDAAEGSSACYSLSAYRFLTCTRGLTCLLDQTTP